MKKSLLAIAAALTVTALPTVSFAADGLAFNVGVTTDYRYRGISQTRLKPALQGGVDYTAGPFYAGAWASTIKWIKDGGTIGGVDAGSANAEIDLYGGYKGEITKDLTFDVGGLYYWYPSNKYDNVSGQKADTFELYGALTFGPATLKYSHGVSHLFGNPDSKNSYYLDLSAGFEVAGLMVTPHIGYQKIKGPVDAQGTYTDYSLTVSKDFDGLVLSAAIVGTDADKSWYVAPSGKFLGKTALVVGLKYNF